MPESLLPHANQALAHFKSLRVASIPLSIDSFSNSITVGVRINDSDFDFADPYKPELYSLITYGRNTVNHTVLLHGSGTV